MNAQAMEVTSDDEAAKPIGLVPRSPDAAQPAYSPVMAIVQAQPNINPDALQKLLDAEHQERRFQARQAWMAAMTRFRADVGVSGKSGRNAHLKSEYATLDDLVIAATQPLSDNGLTMRWEQTQDRENAWTTAICIVSHRDGHEERTEYGVPVEGNKGVNGAQAWGIASSYARRYALAAALGIATEDRDGRMSTKEEAPPTPATERQLQDVAAKLDEAPEDVREAFKAAYSKKYGAADNALGVDLPASAVTTALKAIQAKIDGASE